MAGESGDREQAETRLPAATPLCDRSHLLHQFTGRAHSRLDDLDSVLTATMPDAERGETIAFSLRRSPLYHNIFTLHVRQIA